MKFVGAIGAAGGSASILGVESDGTLVKGISASGTTVTQATISVDTVSTYAEIVVAAVGITTAHKVMVSFVGQLDVENDLETISDDGILIFAVAETGQIRFVLTSDFFMFGNFTINYWTTL